MEEDSDTRLAPDELASAIDGYLAGNGPEWGDGRPWPQTIAVETDDLKDFHGAAVRLLAEAQRLRRIETAARAFYGQHFRWSGVVWVEGSLGDELREALAVDR